jgi:hypothetical protein
METPFDKLLFEENAAPRDRRFPIVPCLVAILLTSAGLAAAALNIRWSAAPPPDRTDALEAAWPYVHALLALLWLIAWPALALARRRPATPDALQAARAALAWDFTAISAGAIPALLLAAFLSSITPALALRMFALQASLALLAGGTLAFALGNRLLEALATGLLAALAVAGPLAVYFWAEFFPAAGDGWFTFLPLIAVARAARDGPPAPAFWWLIAIISTLGLTLAATSRLRPQPDE